MKLTTYITKVLLLLALLPISANAADLRVRVFERGAAVPLAGVAVCMGTHARPDQFGAVYTDNKGYALFDELPQAQLLVTASLAGYKSEQETMVTSNTNRMLVLSLSAGGGGADCAVSLPTDRTTVSLAIKRFAINKGARSTTSQAVQLHNSLTGMATQYRASEDKDLEGVDWQYYSTAPDFSLSAGPGLKNIYLQVRRHSAVNGATLETLSPVVRDTIRLR